MREEHYTSQDGFTVYIDSNGDLDIRNSEGALEECIVSGLVRSVEEFFRHKRDKRLGIWRNPDRPIEVVYPIEKDRIHVLNETSGWTTTWERKQVEHNAYVDHFGFDTAHAYFTAISKPWHEAKEGEVWAIGLLEDGPSACLVTKGDFVETTGLFEVAIDSSLIESGRKIWPADD